MPDQKLKSLIEKIVDGLITFNAKEAHLLGCNNENDSEGELPCQDT
jgi:hypothetical protein